MGIGDAWGTREELLHPRGKNGRFIKKLAMSPAIVDMVRGILDGFSPRTFPSDGAAGQWAHNRAKPSRFNGGSGVARFTADFDNVQEDLRDGVIDDPSTKKYISMMDASSIELPDDVIVTRVVGPDSFGMTPEQMNAPDGQGGIYDLIGSTMADRGYHAAQLGTPQPSGTGNITLYMAVPKGTKAVIPASSPSDRAIVLDRDQEWVITKVKPDGRGGYSVSAVASPRTPGETPAPQGVGHMGAGKPKNREAAIRDRKASEQKQMKVPEGGEAPPIGAEAIHNPPSPVGPAATGPGAPAPRTEKVVSESVGGGGGPAPTGPAPAAPSPQAPEAPAADVPAAPQPDLPVTPVGLKDVVREANLPSPSAGDRRRSWNNAYSGSLDSKKDPVDVLRELDSDLTQFKIKQSAQGPDGKDTALDGDIEALEKLRDVIATHFGLPDRVEPKPAPKKAANGLEARPVGPPRSDADKVPISPGSQSFGRTRKKGEAGGPVTRSKGEKPPPVPKLPTAKEREEEDAHRQVLRDSIDSLPDGPLKTQSQKVLDQMDKDASEEDVWRPWVKGSGVTERSLSPKERSDLGVIASDLSADKITRDEAIAALRGNGSDRLKKMGDKLAGTPQKRVRKAKTEPVDDLDGMTVAELKAAAKEAGIKGYSKLLKDDLKKVIRDKREGKDKTPDVTPVKKAAKKAAPESKDIVQTGDVAEVRTAIQAVKDAPTAEAARALLDERSDDGLARMIRVAGIEPSLGMPGTREQRKNYLVNNLVPVDRLNDSARRARAAREAAAPTPDVIKLDESAALTPVGRGTVRIAQRDLKKGEDPADVVSDLRRKADELRDGEPLDESDLFEDRTSHSDEDVAEMQSITARRLDEIADDLETRAAKVPAKKAAPANEAQAALVPSPGAKKARLSPSGRVTLTPEQRRDVTDLSPAEQREYRTFRRQGQDHGDSLQSARDKVGVREADKAAVAEKRLAKKAAPAAPQAPTLLRTVLDDMDERRQLVAESGVLKKRADAVARLDEIVDNEASDRALRHTIDNSGLPEAVRADLTKAVDSGDREAVRKAIGRARGKDLKPVGKAGESTKFDRRVHKPIGKDLREGQQVRVVRQGHEGTRSDGSTVLLDRAVVESDEPAVPAKKAATKKSLMSQMSPADRGIAQELGVPDDHPLAKIARQLGDGSVEDDRALLADLHPDDVKQLGREVGAPFPAGMKPGDRAEYLIRQIRAFGYTPGETIHTPAVKKASPVAARRQQALDSLREQGINNPSQMVLEEQMRTLADTEARDLIRATSGGGPRQPAATRDAARDVARVRQEAADARALKAADTENKKTYGPWLEAAGVNDADLTPTDRTILNLTVEGIRDRKITRPEAVRRLRAADSPRLQALADQVAIRPPRAKKAVPAAPAAAPDLLTRLNDFDNPPTREEAAALIEGLKRPQLVEMAKSINVPGASTKNMTELRLWIIDGTVGNRRDSIATRGFRGIRPDMPDTPASARVLPDVAVRAEEPLKAPDGPETERAKSFKDAWDEKGFTLPGGSAQRSMDEIRDDLHAGKITPDEAVRRVESEISFNQQDLMETEAAIRGISTIRTGLRTPAQKVELAELRSQRGVLRGNIGVQEDASKFLRSHFNQEPVRTPEEIQAIKVELPEASKSWLDKATPEDMRETAKQAGLNPPKGNTAEEMFDDLMLQTIDKALAERAAEQAGKAAKKAAPAKITRPADAFEGLDLKEIGKGLDLSLIPPGVLKDIQADLDAGKMTPAAIGRKLDNWANGPSGPFYKSAVAVGVSGDLPEVVAEAAEFKRQGREWVKLAERLKVIRRKRAAAPKREPAVLTPKDEARAADIADLTGVPEAKVQEAIIDRKEASAPASDHGKGVADLLETVGSREEAAALLKGKTKPELWDIAKAAGVQGLGSRPSKLQMEATIIQEKVGRRLDSDAIGRVATPVSPEGGAPAGQAPAVTDAGPLKRVRPEVDQSAGEGPQERPNADEPLRLGGGQMSGTGNMHADSNMGELWNDLYRDDRAPNSVLNEIARLATSMSQGDRPFADIMTDLRRLANSQSDLEVKTRIMKAIDNIDAPPFKMPTLPDSTPAVLRQMVEDLGKIPTARRRGVMGTSGRDKSVIDDLVDAIGKIDRNEGDHFQNQRELEKHPLHESRDGATQIWKIFDQYGPLGNREKYKAIRLWMRERASAVPKPSAERLPPDAEVLNMTIPELRRLAATLGMPDADGARKDALLAFLLP